VNVFTNVRDPDPLHREPVAERLVPASDASSVSLSVWRSERVSERVSERAITHPDSV
jgi:hypothetical protein